MRLASLAAAALIVGSAPAQADTERLLVISAKEHALILVDPATARRQAIFRVGLAPEDLAVSADGRTAVVSNRGDELAGTTITVLDLASQKVARTIVLETRLQRPDGSEVVRRFHRPTGLALVARDTKVLVACASESAVLLVDLAEGRVEGEVRIDTRDPMRIVLGHDGRHAFVSSRTSGAVSVIDVEEMRIVRRVQAGAGASAMALHPKRNELWVANSDVNTLSIIATDALEEIVEFPCGAMPSDVAFTADGRHVLVTNLQEGNISVFVSETRRVHTVVDLEHVAVDLAEARPAPSGGNFGTSAFPTCLLMHPSGKTAFVAMNRSDSVTEIDLATWRPVRKLDVLRLPTGMAWSRVASGGAGARAVPSPNGLGRTLDGPGR